jgi:hypothetical protein
MGLVTLLVVAALRLASLTETAGFWSHTATIVGPMAKKLIEAAEECGLHDIVQHCGALRQLRATRGGG